MIFLAFIHESLSVTSLMPRSEALSLILTIGGVGAAGGGGTAAGGVGSEDESPRTDTEDPKSGCAKGMKGGAGEAVVDILRISTEGRITLGPPPIADAPPRDAPPMTELLPRKVRGDIPPWLPPMILRPPMLMCCTGTR